MGFVVLHCRYALPLGGFYESVYRGDTCERFSGLLEGMLGADLIGFHTSDYVGHFLKSLSMCLGTEHDGQHIVHKQREISIDAFPVSIDFELFHQASELPAVKAARVRYLKIKDGRKMIFSVDRLDYTKGIFNRLKAYVDKPE